jgi:hypothetical protein
MSLPSRTPQSPPVTVCFSNQHPLPTLLLVCVPSLGLPPRAWRPPQGGMPRKPSPEGAAAFPHKGAAVASALKATAAAACPSRRRALSSAVVPTTDLWAVNTIRRRVEREANPRERKEDTKRMGEKSRRSGWALGPEIWKSCLRCASSDVKLMTD